jgi:predicted peptidase
MCTIEEREMKTRKLFISVMLLSTVSVLLAANTEEYCGTWVNKEYDADPGKTAMSILTPDGKYATYEKESDAQPDTTGTLTIKEKWTDSKGDIWYKVTYTSDVITVTLDGLMKLSNSGKTLESVFSPGQAPTAIDAKSPYYRIRYRK